MPTRLTPSWVYILRCRDGSYYTGCTSDLRKRMMEHEEGVHDGYTSERRPVKLIWTCEFRDIQRAIKTEHQIKRWSRAKKEALMKGDFELLHELAQSKEARERRLKSSNRHGERNGAK